MVTNIRENFDQKKPFDNLISELKKSYHIVNYVNLSMGVAGVVGKDSDILAPLRYFKLSSADILSCW